MINLPKSRVYNLQYFKDSVTGRMPMQQVMDIQTEFTKNVLNEINYI